MSENKVWPVQDDFQAKGRFLRNVAVNRLVQCLWLWIPFLASELPVSSHKYEQDSWFPVGIDVFFFYLENILLCY